MACDLEQFSLVAWQRERFKRASASQQHMPYVSTAHGISLEACFLCLETLADSKSGSIRLVANHVISSKRVVAALSVILWQ